MNRHWTPSRPDQAKAAVDRAAPRHKTFEPTLIETPAGSERAHVLNLSTTGALLHATAGLPVGTTITIPVAGRRVSATVVWSEGARFGIRFQMPLHPDEVDRAIG